jgi:hypothetical protein
LNKQEIKSEEGRNSITWTVHPFKESVKATILVIFIIMFICGVVYYSFGEIFWVILSLIFLLGSLSSFFFPTTFTLDDEKVRVKRVFTTITRAWNAFRGFYWDKNGVQLTPFSHPSRLDSYRGLFLKFGGNKEEVLDFIKSHLKSVDQKNK